MASPISHRNKSPFGWWIASYLERLEWSDESRRNTKRKCLAWENTVLVKAANRQQAWRKAMAIGKLSEGNPVHDSKGRKGLWHFEGLTSLLPVYDKLEHGAELLWVEHNNRTVATVKAMVKTKGKLETFDDRGPGRGKAST